MSIPKWELSKEGRVVTASLRLTANQAATLNATIGRIELGYSAFETDVVVPTILARQAQARKTNRIFGRQRYPLYLRSLQHFP